MFSERSRSLEVGGTHPALVEAFGRVILEAMAAGVAVIGSAVGEIPEMLDHGGAGVLVPPGDEKELAAAIAMLDENKRRRTELAEKSVYRVKKVYNLNDQAKTIAGVYDALLEERARGRGAV